MSFFAALLFVFFLADVLWWALAWRRLKSRGAVIAATAWGGAMLAGVLVIITSRYQNHGWDDALIRPVLSITYLWHLLILPPWLAWQLVRLLGRGARKLLPAAVTDAPAVSRREFLTMSATFAPAILTSGGALAAEGQLEHFRVRRLNVPVSGLPAALEGLTIAQVSDLHLGRFTRGPILERIVRAANDLDAGLVVITGDLINFALRDLPAGIDLVRGLRGRHGVFLCEGNHDLIEDGPEFRRRVLHADLPFLRGEAVPLPIAGAKLQLLGLPWTHGDAEHTRAIAALEPVRRADAFPLLLAHHPHVFDSAKGYPLTLAGHTHGGQLMLNEQLGFGPAFFRYWSGLYRRGDRSLVVSNGVGNWFPIRLAAPAEILHLTLRRAS